MRSRTTSRHRRAETIAGSIIAGLVTCGLSAYRLFADCPPSPTTLGTGVIEGRVSSAGDLPSKDGTLAVNAVGQFAVAYSASTDTAGGTPLKLYFRRFDADGSCLGDALLVAAGTSGPHGNSQFSPSIAMTADGTGWLEWSTGFPECTTLAAGLRRNVGFSFDDAESPPTQATLLCQGDGDQQPSAGISDAGVPATA